MARIAAKAVAGMALVLGLSQADLCNAGVKEWEAAMDRADAAAANKDYTGAERHYRAALKEAESLGDQSKIAETLDNLATLIMTEVANGAPEARYAEAEPLLLRMLAIHERTAGPKSGAVQNDLELLVALYRLQKRFSEADAMRQRRLAISKENP
jgi:tetratricopeptide (TPR) repeat protein